jgi:hypothetical protein
VKGEFAIAAQQPIVNVGRGHSMRRRKKISSFINILLIPPHSKKNLENYACFGTSSSKALLPGVTPHPGLQMG